MIGSLRGIMLSQNDEKALIEASGVGYEVFVTSQTAARLPASGAEVFLHIAESFGLYGGATTLYGFLTTPERALFEAFKNEVPGTGAKKALEYLDKASKSLPDFRRAILEKDGRLLCGVFGFTKKTADKLIDSLKDKLETVPVPGHERIKSSSALAAAGALSQALSALSSLGYKAAEARFALQAVSEENPGQDINVETLVRMALKRL